MAGEGDSERLVVLFEARLKDFEKAQARIEKTTNSLANLQRRSRSATAEMESNVTRASARINAALASTSTKIGAFSKSMVAGFAAGFTLREAQNLIDSAIKIQNALKVVGLSGKDLDSVYQSLFASALKNGAPLETLVELYSKAALQQKELGVTSKQLLEFTDNVAVALRVQGTDAQSASGALLQLSQMMGTGIVRAQEFNSVLDQVPTIMQAAAAGLKEAGGSVAKLRNLVVTGKVSSAAFFAAFEDGSYILQDRVAGASMTVSQAFENLNTVMIDVAGKFNESTNASQGLVNFMNGPLTESIREIGALFNELANGPIGQFVSLVNKATDEMLRAAEAFGKATGLSKVGEALGAKPYSQVMAEEQGSDHPLEVTVTKPHGQVSLKDYPVKPQGAGTGAAKTRLNSYQRETQSIEDRTKAIEAQTAAQASVNPLVDDYGQAVETARTKQELLNAAQKAGVKVTPDIAASIDQLADKYGSAYAAAQKLAKSQDDIRQAAEDNLNAARGVVKGVIDDLRQGKNAGEIFADAISKIADRIEDQLLNAIFKVNDASSSGGSSILGWLFKGLGSLLGGSSVTLPDTAPIPTPRPFANGTDSAPGGLSLIGERGPELMNVPRGASIMSNAKLAQALSGGSGSRDVNVTVGVSVDKNGNLEAYVKNVAQRESANTVSAYDRGLPDRVHQIKRDPRAR